MKKKLYPLFVYGSLKSGSDEHDQMKGAGKGKTVQTAPLYKLIEKDGYVELIKGGKESVPGELYHVDADKLKQLRKWEYKTFHKEPITLSDGKKVLAFVFHK